MMTAMTSQPPLPLMPGGARLVGAAAAIIEDADGGRVFVHGNLSYAWDAGDTAARRFAAVSLMRIKAATQLDIAEAFAVKPATVRRWEARLTDVGIAGLIGESKGPKRKSKLTDDMVAAIRGLREGGASYRGIATAAGVSMGSIRIALTDSDAAAGAEIGDDRDTQTGAEKVGDATDSDASPVPEPEPGDVELPVLADPVDRAAERALAAFGLIAYAPPVFTGCARAPLAGLLLGLPALVATGLLQCAHTAYGGLPNGFYSLDTMLCEAVFRALLGGPRAEGAVRIDPPALGRVLGLDRAPEVKTIRRKITYLAGAGKAGDWIAAMARRHVHARPEQAAVLYVDGHVRAYQGTRKIAKTHVPRLKFPAPATLETWVADAAGDPLLVVPAEPGASLAGELRRLIPALRAMVGDERRVLVGFDRGGWSPTLFADLHAAGLDTLTWRKGATTDIDENQFTEHTHIDSRGRTHTWALADTEVELDITDGPRKGQVFPMRQISLFDNARTRQMHILTTRAATCPPLRSATGWDHAGARKITTATRVSTSTSTRMTATAPPTTTRPGWCPTRPRKPPTIRSKKLGGHCIRPKPPATPRCWPRPRRNREPRCCSPTRRSTPSTPTPTPPKPHSTPPPRHTGRSRPGYRWPRSTPASRSSTPKPN
jgi:prepilin-type processing-associated H-X9-DG protein